tara:strand:- start:564 stop:1286 length:723 start_codon:yes stop_codon:yes gene_type:complete
MAFKPQQNSKSKKLKFLPFLNDNADPVTIFLALTKKYSYSPQLINTFYIIRSVGLKEVKDITKSMPDLATESGIHKTISNNFSSRLPRFSFEELDTCLNVLRNVDPSYHGELPEMLKSSSSYSVNSYMYINSFMYVDYLLGLQGDNVLTFSEEAIAPLFNGHGEEALKNISSLNLFSSSAGELYFDSEDDLKHYVLAGALYNVKSTPVCPVFSFTSITTANTGVDYATQPADHSTNPYQQ